MYGELPEGFQLNQVKAEKLPVKGSVGVISVTLHVKSGVSYSQ